MAANSKPSRKSRFAQADGSIIADELAATNAYLAIYGELGERYQHTADNAHTNLSISVKVNGNYIQDRYK